MTAWEPNDEVVEDVLDVGPARRLHGLLDAPGPPPAAGDALPMLWHGLYFGNEAPQSLIGPDGHPRTGGFLPPTPYPRRMFGGAEVTIDRALEFGRPVVRRGRATRPEEKSGRSGPLAFVSVGYDLTDDADGRVREQQQLIYRPASTGETAPSTTRPVGAVPDWPWSFELAADPVLLFRFSALTYNAHRIHYDHPYVTGVEGYPGLIVHGPLVAIGLAELVRRFAPDRPLRRLAYRAGNPAFAPTTLRFVGRETDDGTVELAAFDAEGVPLMRAEGDLGTGPAT